MHILDVTWAKQEHKSTLQNTNTFNFNSEQEQEHLRFDPRASRRNAKPGWHTRCKLFAIIERLRQLNIYILTVHCAQCTNSLVCSNSFISLPITFPLLSKKILLYCGVMCNITAYTTIKLSIIERPSLVHIHHWLNSCYVCLHEVMKWFTLVAWTTPSNISIYPKK